MNVVLAELLGEAAQLLTKMAIDATAEWMRFEDRAVKALRSTGQSGEQLRSITNHLIKDTANLARQYGVTFDELTKFQQKFSEITKSTAVLSSDSMEDFAALTKVFGDSAPFEWAEAMQKFGMSTKTSNTWLGRASIEAKALGLNSELFAKEMAKSVGLQNRLNFRNGIQGLEKMTGLAMRLGTSIESLSKHIDIDSGSFSDIEKSIESSAKLQRLGGSFGAAFSNPLEVMAEGMFDAESAMERVAKALEGKGTFDKATGQVNMGWYDKKSIGVAAEALGITADEARTIANNQVKGNAIEQDLKKSGLYGNFSQENIDAIKNLAQYNPENQQFEITYTDSYGNEQKAGLKELTPEKLDKIVGLKENEKNIDRNVASIARQVRQINDAVHGKAQGTVTADEEIDANKETTKAWYANLANKFGLDWLVTKGKESMQDMGAGGHVALNTIMGGRAKGGLIQSTPTGLDGVQKFEKGGIVDAIASDAIRNDGYKAGEIIKPLAEPHYSGGVVGGYSYSGDKVLTRLNSGEMVLNPSQQANLYAIANNRTASGVNQSIIGANIVTKFGNDASKFYQSASDKFGKIADSINKANAVRKGRQIGKIAASLGKTNITRANLLNNNDYGVRVARMMVRKKMPELANLHEFASQTLTKGATTSLDKTKAIASSGKNAANKLMHSTKIGRRIQSEVFGAKLYIQQTKLYDKLGTSIDKFSSASKTFGSKVGEFGAKTASGTVKASTRIAQGGLKYTGKAISGISNLATKADSAILKGTTKVLGKRIGNVVKGAGPLGVAISAGIGLMDASSAISDFSDFKKSIESRDDLTRSQKKAQIREAEDKRNEKVGGAAGSVIGGAIGASIGSAIPVFGTAIGAMAGSFIGEKIGGFVGKSINGVKETFFGKEGEITEEDQAQLDYEESKFGATSLEDDKLMEKAALATIKSHDLLISIWNHMNGREFNGEEKSKGLFGHMADGVKGLAQGAVGLTSSLLMGPVGTMAMAFGKNKKKKGDKEQTDVVSEILGTVNKINVNIEAFLGNSKNDKSDVEGVDAESEETKTEAKFSTRAKKMGIGGLIGSALLGPIGAITGIAAGALIGNNTTNAEVEPKPLGEDAVSVKDTSQTTSQENTSVSIDPIKIEISGTIKIDGGSVQKEIDTNKLLDNPSLISKLRDSVWKGLEEIVGFGRMNMNTRRNVLRGSTVNMA